MTVPTREETYSNKSKEWILKDPYRPRDQCLNNHLSSAPQLNPLVTNDLQ